MNGINENDYRMTPDKCKKCGGHMVYKGLGEYVCEECKSVEYDEYGLVRNYIESNRGATVVEISMATGVSQSAINRLLREDRLEIASSSRLFLKCAVCGKDIRSGKYCPTCGKLAEAAKKKKAQRDSPKRDIVGFGNNAVKGQSGAKRFRRGE